MQEPKVIKLIPEQDAHGDFLNLLSHEIKEETKAPTTDEMIGYMELSLFNMKMAIYSHNPAKLRYWSFQLLKKASCYYLGQINNHFSIAS